MENKITIEIEGIHARETAKGVEWWSVETDKGKMSCWDRDLVKELSNCFESNRAAVVEVSKTNGYTNIKRFVAIAEAVHDLEAGVRRADVAARRFVEKEATASQAAFKDQRAAKDQSIYTSYAKDINIALLEFTPIVRKEKYTVVDYKSIMALSIELVKQAREAFG